MEQREREGEVCMKDESWEHLRFGVFFSSEMTMTTMMMRYVDEFRMNELRKECTCKTYWAFNMRTLEIKKNETKCWGQNTHPDHHAHSTGRMWWFILLIRVKHIFSLPNDFEFYFVSFSFFFTIHRVYFFGVGLVCAGSLKLKGSCSNE